MARIKNKSPKRSVRQPARMPAAAAPVVSTTRLARVAKGKKPQYFSDPAIDKLLWMTMSLMEELAVTRDRLDTVERLLAGKRLLRVAEIEAFVPSEAAAGERAERRAAVIDRMMRAVHAELEEITARSAPGGDDDAVAAVSS